MDIAWSEYKPILKKAYFGDYEGALAPKDTDQAADFWSFHDKYVRMAARKGAILDILCFSIHIDCF